MSKSRAAVERAQEAAGKKKNKVFGQYFIAEPRVMDGGDMPTKGEWLEEQERKNNNSSTSKFGGADNRQVKQGRK